MEITDILKSENLNYNTSKSAISKNKEDNKFHQLVEKSISESKKNETHTDNKKGKPINRKLMDTCIEMESIFVGKMLKEMRNSIPQEKLIDGGHAEKIFDDMLYDNYALNISKNSNLGLASMLYRDLSKM